MKNSKNPTLDEIYEKIDDLREIGERLRYLQRLYNIPTEEFEKNFELIFPRLIKILKLCGKCDCFHICLKIGKDSILVGCPYEPEKNVN